MKSVILWIWQLPQHLLGLLLIILIRAKHSNDNGCWRGRKFITMWGVSMGQYRIFSGYTPSLVSIHHEEGHSIQSLYLGPLYLIVVGIPSVLRNLFFRLYRWYHNTWNEYYDLYYKGYPENWADRLGGVIR